MHGNPYAAAGMQQQQQQQQLNNGQYAAAGLRQQQSRPGSPLMPGNSQPMQQQRLGVETAYGPGGSHQHAVQQHLQGRQIATGRGMRQQAMQATPDRLGITPVQLAMLQQQRLQQGRANQLVVTPSIHSVTSSNRSWSEEQ